MKVSAQYACDHFAELITATDNGEEVEVARDGKPSIKLLVMPKATGTSPVSDTGRRMLGAGRGELVLPTDEEWKALDREVEDSMSNGPIFPHEQQ